MTRAVYYLGEPGTGKTTLMARRLTGWTVGPYIRKLAGRPFKNPDVRARVAAARAAGESVSAALSYVSTTPPEPFTKDETEDYPDLEFEPVPEPVGETETEDETRQQRKNRLARERAAAKKLL